VAGPVTSSATKQSSIGGAELDSFACACNDDYLPQKYSKLLRKPAA
jgi:hypothetical protein